MFTLAERQLSLRRSRGSNSANSVPSTPACWVILAPNCFASAAIIRIPNPLLLVRSKPAGNPTPSSRTDMSAEFSSCRDKRTQMCPLERSDNACLTALVTSSLTIRAARAGLVPSKQGGVSQVANRPPAISNPERDHRRPPSEAANTGKPRAEIGPGALLCSEINHESGGS